MSMVQVKTLKPHGNSFGDKYHKAVGDEYPLPAAHAKLLEDQEIVEPVKKVAPAK
jgi:hypothetical protein